ncbi:alpha/beta hydrolase [Kosakonia oryzae]|uniref:alpha/beta hydrolase n=1 Tax=Kosakonia oryzae TaxID=497725 RepID=UPI001D06C2F1|nr:alpha/beta hydrolase [Kosakonia oryzae]UDJ84673.1 alpha/beta hydrolase [Kosakonia oryzae]
MKACLSIEEFNQLYHGKQFSLKTMDGKACLNGQINWPLTYDKDMPIPIVILCPGSGLHNRDYLIGESNTNNDFVFLALAQELLNSGIAVARYDCRGVSSHRRDALLDEPEFILQKDLAYRERFVDCDIRRTVTPQSQCDDIFTIYEYLLENSKALGISEFILLGHSEGGLNISRMISRYNVSPIGVLLISPPILSMSDIMRWQLYERYIKWLKMIPHSGDVITFDDIKNGYGNSPQAFIDNISKIIPYKGFWDYSDLDKFLKEGEANYKTQKSAAFSHSDEEPWPSGAPFTQYSYSWWKQHFSDDNTPEFFNLKNTMFPVYIFLGDIDTQLDNEKQYSFYTQNRYVFPNVKISLLKGVGHTLGLHALMGPVTDECMEEIVMSVLQIICPE